MSATRSRNTGTGSEKIFEDQLLKHHGTKVYAYRFEDAKETRGLNGGKAVLVSPRPADYVVTINGVMFYAEVKSSTNARNATFKLRPGQKAAMRRQIAAGGEYRIYFHCIPRDEWYCIPANDLLDRDRMSFTFQWSNFEPFRIWR